MVCSTGSDLTGVFGGVGEVFRLELPENETVRDLRRLRLWFVVSGSG